MKLTVIDKTDTEVRIEIADESHTLLNSLKTLLLNDPRVELATYHVEHPTFEEFKTVFNNKASI